ncbi:hypothetical protein [Elizabethkingia ursingii]|uniref:hypothetical protein n=1 Tax=Elizabethkingia ursingii TaxID=1756150 RepID=UPI002012AF90|nr:hypothetical protein [Elizabethkingia ursingii]MCL1670498.1 hypothetical protein [Elizabethkingia ursingii]
MKIKYFEYIVVYLSVLIVCFMIGGFARIVSIKKGADEYTANVFFWICTGSGILIFALLSLFLNELVERILKRFRKTKSEFAENQVMSQNFNKIREEQQAKIGDENQIKLEIAIEYTQKQFALYASNEDLKLLCDYIIMYSNKSDFENVVPIKVNNLLSLDIYHFGWNIWNHFKVGKQERIAVFLKLVFANILKDVEVESIKSHLKDDEQKGIIKIAENLSD